MERAMKEIEKQKQLEEENIFGRTHRTPISARIVRAGERPLRGAGRDGGRRASRPRRVGL